MVKNFFTKGNKGKQVSRILLLTTIWCVLLEKDDVLFIVKVSDLLTMVDQINVNFDPSLFIGRIEIKINFIRVGGLTNYIFV